MRHRSLEHRFVRNVPRELEPGVLYVSMEYATAVHSCCCGCRERVVTPFTPTDWQMTFDGDSVSLHPSVGNWNQACRSHYVIRRNHVLEAVDDDDWKPAPLVLPKSPGDKPFEMTPELYAVVRQIQADLDRRI